MINNNDQKNDDLKILAGPILRRVDITQVCVWIATNKKVKVNLKIFRLKEKDDSFLFADKSNDNKSNLSIGEGNSESLQIGKKLSITLVIAKPSQQENDNSTTIFFPTDQILGYDLEFLESETNNKKNLSDFGLLNTTNGIIYKKMPLPTFFLREKSPFNIIHGSCRMLHGDGNDALENADNIISENQDKTSIRPSSLFLTGDQIYADDVAGPLIQYITNMAKDLIGEEEQIPFVKKLSDIPVYGRQSLVTDKAKFTTEEGYNHLLSFGEFAAMYLISWNADNWPKDSFPDFTRNLDLEPLSILDLKSPHHESIFETKYECDTENLYRYYTSNPKNYKKNPKDVPWPIIKIRRLLANIPTYMILDDHEITDDWNMDLKWHENVYSNELGRRIISNGLVAYWAFQGWGNDPDRFDSQFIDEIIKYVNNDSAKKDAIDLFETHLKERGWSFAISSNPQIVFLDSRTKRKFNESEKAARLVGDEELSALLDIVKPLPPDSGDPIIIITPTPVYGYKLAEKIQTSVANVARYYVDFESWHANILGFQALLTFINEKLNPSYCVFLSGDVHYAFSEEALFIQNHGIWESENFSKKLQIIQLTSSAFKKKYALLLKSLNELNTNKLFKIAASFLLPDNNSKNNDKNDVWSDTQTMVRTDKDNMIITENNLGIVKLDSSKITHELFTLYPYHEDVKIEIVKKFN